MNSTFFTATYLFFSFNYAEFVNNTKWYSFCLYNIPPKKEKKNQQKNPSLENEFLKKKICWNVFGFMAYQPLKVI